MSVSIQVFDCEKVKADVIDSLGTSYFYTLSFGEIKIFGGHEDAKAKALMALSDFVDQIRAAAQSLYDRENVVDMQASVEAKFTLTEENGILVQGKRDE